MEDYIGVGGAILFAGLLTVGASRQPVGDAKRHAYLALAALVGNYGFWIVLHGRALIFKFAILFPLAIFALVWTVRAVRDVKAQNDRLHPR